MGLVTVVPCTELAAVAASNGFVVVVAETFVVIAECFAVGIVSGATLVLSGGEDTAVAVDSVESAATLDGLAVLSGGEEFSFAVDSVESGATLEKLAVLSGGEEFSCAIGSVESGATLEVTVLAGERELEEGRGELAGGKGGTEDGVNGSLGTVDPSSPPPVASPALATEPSPCPVSVPFSDTN